MADVPLFLVSASHADMLLIPWCCVRLATHSPRWPVDAAVRPGVKAMRRRRP